MNETDQRELAALREQQVKLEEQLRDLARKLQTFEQHLANSPSRAADANVAGTAAMEILPGVAQTRPAPAAPPVIRPVSQPASPIKPGNAPEILTARQSSTTAAKLSLTTVQSPRDNAAPETGAAPGSTANSPSVSAAGAEYPPRSFEMRLGTFWLVRVGVVMVLTGLVFFGNLAYHSYISKLGAGGKVSLLYFASSLLLAAGWWWQRSTAKESLRNYAQVLFGGGLGALYFTTYAAHHLQALQVIDSASIDGTLLLACAGFMVWAAERKHSEVLAFFAVGLGYYTSVITRVGYFTLWSNLVLSGAAVFFLVRNRWAGLSFGSLVATYAAYGFWRFFDGTNWHWASPAEGLWAGTIFLFCYWLIFTSAVFLSRAERFSGQARAGFLTLNNSALFTLFLLTMLQVGQHGFWKFTTIYGVVLLGLAALSSRALRTEPLASNMYLGQGLLLVTVGIISKFSGLQLGLVLATESVLLALLGQQRRSPVLLAGSYISALLAVGWSVDSIRPFEPSGVWLGSGVGLLMMANAWIVRTCVEDSASARDTAATARIGIETAFFAVLSILSWVVVTWNYTAHEVFPLWVALEAALLSASIYLLRLPEVALLGQPLLLLANVSWAFNRLDVGATAPWWNPALLITINLALSHWWSFQKVLVARSENRVVWPAFYAVSIVAILYLWLAPRSGTPGWLVTTSLLALALTAYGVATRAWFVAAAGQIFTAVAVVQFGIQLLTSKPPWSYPLLPIALIAALSFATVQWFRMRPGGDQVREPLLQLAMVYRWVAVVMSITWVCDYIPTRERTWVFALAGLAAFILAGLRQNREALLMSGAFSATGLVLFWLSLGENAAAYLPNLLAVILLLAQVQFARRLPQRFALSGATHNIIIVVGSLSLWLFFSRWVLEMANGFYLTASWSLLALALFSTGLLLRERMYRWVGLALLAVALGRVMIFDIWRLEAIYRILSFMALGIVLLVLGFIYSKYQEKIKEWL